MPQKDKEAYREYMREYMLKRYHKRRKLMVEHLGGECFECGSMEALEVDHVDRAKKTMDVSRMAFVSEERMFEELNGCQLLCRSCHALKSIKDTGKKVARGNHGTISTYRYCKCDECRRANTEHCRKKREERRELRGPRPPKKLKEHGTRPCYRAGCRCDLCREAQTVWMREYRKNKKAKPGRVV